MILSLWFASFVRVGSHAHLRNFELPSGEKLQPRWPSCGGGGGRASEVWPERWTESGQLGDHPQAQGITPIARLRQPRRTHTQPLQQHKHSTKHPQPVATSRDLPSNLPLERCPPSAQHRPRLGPSQARDRARPPLLTLVRATRQHRFQEPHQQQLSGSAVGSQAADNARFGWMGPDRTDKPTAATSTDFSAAALKHHKLSSHGPQFAPSLDRGTVSSATAEGLKSGLKRDGADSIGCSVCYPTVSSPPPPLAPPAPPRLAPPCLALPCLARPPRLPRALPTQACRLCKHRKIRCDGIRPVCGSCLKSAIAKGE